MYECMFFRRFEDNVLIRFFFFLRGWLILDFRNRKRHNLSRIPLLVKNLIEFQWYHRDLITESGSTACIHTVFFYKVGIIVYQVPSAERFTVNLGCADPSTRVKVVAIVGNSGDGKSHTLNQVSALTELLKQIKIHSRCFKITKALCHNCAMRTLTERFIPTISHQSFSCKNSIPI